MTRRADLWGPSIAALAVVREDFDHGPAATPRACTRHGLFPHPRSARNSATQGHDRAFVARTRTGTHNEPSLFTPSRRFAASFLGLSPRPAFINPPLRGTP